MKHILIVEDDADIAEIERDYLEINNFKVTLLPDGSQLKNILDVEHVDLILLDVMLPGKDGFQLCREIRNAYDIPILMVTARSDSTDTIRGLGLGADDYITKPFNPSELIARVKSHLERYERLVKSNLANEQVNNAKETSEKLLFISSNKLEIEAQSYRVFINSNEIKITTKEFELLLFLATHPNRVFSKEQLYNLIWKQEYSGDISTVTVHINRIREKIEENSAVPQFIETIRGVGYRFSCQNEQKPISH